MSRVFLDIEYGKQALSKDDRVKTCYVYRYNRYTKRNKRIKLYYIEVETLYEVNKFCGSYALDFVLDYSQLIIDDKEFDFMLKVMKQSKKGLRSAELPAA